MDILFNHTLIIVLRFLHIIAGALWVGASAAYAFLFIPAVTASESAGETVMKKLGPRFHAFMAIMANVTVLAGILLYSRFIVATGLQWIWSTGSGITFTLGAAAGIISFIMGGAFFAPTQKKIESLAHEMQASERPSVEQVTRMNSLQAKMLKAGQLDFVLMVLALGSMAVARYM